VAVSAGDEVLPGVGATTLVAQVRQWVRRVGTAGLRERGIMPEDVEAHCVAVILAEIDRRRRRGTPIRDPQGFVRAFVAFAVRDAARRVTRGGNLEREPRGTGTLHDHPAARVIGALERIDARPERPPHNDHVRFARAYVYVLTQISDFWGHAPDVRLALLCAFSRCDRDDDKPLHRRNANALHQAHHRFFKRLLEALREHSDA
jgi:hypothetical protein